MLLIDTYVGLSPGKGLGLFANQFVPIGSIYWVRNETFDKVIMPEELPFLNNLALEYIKKYGCLEINNNWYLCGDNARFSNHSDLPNTENKFNEQGLLIYHLANRDIQIGEEIVCDYREICQTCKDNLPF